TILVAAYTAWKLAAIAITAVTKAKAIAMGTMVAIQRGAAIASNAWAVAQWALNAAMSANPIGLIVVAIAALVAGLVLAYKKSETFRNIVHGALSAVGAGATWLWENGIKPAWERIKAAFQALGDVVSWLWSKVVKPGFERIGAIAQWLWERIKASFNLWKGVFDRVRGWVSGVRDWVVDRFRKIVDFVKGLPGRIRSAARGMWDGIKEAFRSAVNWLIDKWNNLSF